MLKVSNITAPAVRRAGKLVEVKPDTTRQYNADVILNVSIRLHGFVSKWNTTSCSYEPVPFERVFALGDIAEYDSYNLSYTGDIVAIGAKTVSIRDGSKVRRLFLYEFAWRNSDFDGEKIRARNAETHEAI